MKKFLVGAICLTLIACGSDWIVPVLRHIPGTPAGPDVPCDGGSPLPPSDNDDDAGTRHHGPDAGTVDAGQPDSGVPTADGGTTDGGDDCQPGYGNGDPNHCHDGPPGQDAGVPPATDGGDDGDGGVGQCRWISNDEKECCKPGYGWGDKNHCHIHKEIPGKGGN